ncbi:MAG: hypothetical protein WCD37_04735 [Chloroflexia bacterium]
MAILRYFLTTLVLVFACLLALVACDGDAPVAPEGVPSVAPGLTQGPTQVAAVPTAVSSPTATSIPRVKKGEEVTALRALGQLRGDALVWQKDAMFVMLANVKPGQEGRLLGMALSDPDLSDPTPGGKGGNWVLLAASPSVEGVVALDLDGGKIDLVAEGKVSASLLAQLTGPGVAGAGMADLDVSSLVDSDAIVKKAGEVGSAHGMSMALLAPSRLGLGPLFGEEEEGRLPEVVYQVFAPEPAPDVVFLDGVTGARLGEDAP